MGSSVSSLTLSKLTASSWRQRLILACALVALAIMRLVVGILPFRLIVAAIGLRPGRSPQETDPASEARAVLIGRAVRSAAAHAPWDSTCLVQALAAASLLRFSGIGATLYLGVAKDDGAASEGLTAHAWLRCGGHVLTGEAERDRFAELASFAVG
jgi:hypothetical protein